MKMTTFHLLSFGVFVHVIFLLAIFDIYFTSPVIVGIAPVNNTVPPPGKRVVLISVDGLRVDSVFDKKSNVIKDLMPFVKSVMLEKGTWGISESHVPTESRPGHVAMLAGFYEDPSAVTKGWKENPVTFDSVFNTSFCSFAWGSPDILSIFFKGLNKDCAYSHSYENEQNFAGDTMEYDNWVYEEFELFLQKSKNNEVLYKSGVFFFLHLLGQDTSGHTHKPHTEKYIDNTKNVDRLVKNIERLINDFYNDNLTSFLFTSDHGMTDWGSHGAGHPNETDTPFVAWGAGINAPFENQRPQNINQADITPLLSILLGSPIPVNSIGALPLQYLNLSNNQKAQAMLLNAKQITAQFQTNLQKVKSQIFSFFHTPFEKLTDDELQMMLASISEQIRNKQDLDAIEKSKVLIEIGLEGLEYYQNYYQRVLLMSISASYILWILHLTLELFDTSNSILDLKNWRLTTFFLIFITITSYLILIQKLPLSYGLYILLPQFLLFAVVTKLSKMHCFVTKKNKVHFIASLLIMLMCVEVIVFSFFHRWLLCASLIIVLVWSLFSMNLRRADKFVVSLWAISGFVLSGFCLLPIVGNQPNVPTIMISGFSLFAVLLFLFLLNIHQENIVLYSFRCLAVAAAAWNSAVVHVNFDDDGELSKFNQYLSWSLCVLSFSLLAVGRSFILDRLDQIFMSFLVPFLLLSVSHEGLFIMFLFVHLRCWIYVECENGRSDNEKSRKGSASLSDFRRAYFFLLYVWVGFFGLGNVASLNSFDPAWVRCFLTIFSPFLMSALILFKTVIPFLTVTCSMRTLTVMLKLRPDQLFIVVLIYCNVMGLNFLYFIRNKGSWLDIGSSISHYVIQQVTVVFLLTLYGIAKFLLSPSLHFSTELGKSKRYVTCNDNSVDPTESLLSLPRYYSNHKLHRS